MRLFKFLALASIIFDLSFALAAEPATDLDYLWIENLIKTENLTSVEAVIERLPVSYKSSFTLMRDSRSVQQSSLEFPRAILFGKSGKLIITFNGHPEHRGYDRLEMIEYNPLSDAYEFHFVQFAEVVTFSDTNPKKCIACHTPARLPIWSPDPTWLGAFGEFHDRLTDSEIEFLKSGKLQSHPRYKSLFETADSPVFPFAENDTADILYRPNHRLTKILERFTKRR